MMISSQAQLPGRLRNGALSANDDWETGDDSYFRRYTTIV
jgi:hypothetical protein